MESFERKYHAAVASFPQGCTLRQLYAHPDLMLFREKEIRFTVRMMLDQGYLDVREVGKAERFFAHPAKTGVAE